MKKFIAAFDGLCFSTSTMDYSLTLAKKCDAHLVGVFLEDFTRRSYGMADIAVYEGKDFDKRMHEMDDADRETRERSIETFIAACENRHVRFSVHRDRNIAIQELIHESVYADLLIINSAETLTRHREELPAAFIRDLLSEVQCPVVVVPSKFVPFDKITLLYDGEPSSVHAVRTFSYLFDTFEFESEVVSVKRQEQSSHLPDNKLIKEFIKRHYPKADYVVLKGVAEHEIVRYLHLEKGHPIVVLGAYKRTRLSRLFRPSMADYLLQHLNLPLFIAHNKS